MTTDFDPSEGSTQDAKRMNEGTQRAIDMKTDFDFGSIQTDTVIVMPSEDRSSNGAAANGAAANGVIVENRNAAAQHDDLPAPPTEAVSPVQQEAAPKTRSSRRRIVLIAVGIAVLGAAVYYGIPAIYRYFRYESTDDAFVNGHVTFISPRIAGRVTEVLVENNQYVDAGQLLVRLDREPFQITVDQKRAALAQARQLVDQQVAALDVATAQAQQAHDQARGQLAAVYADWYLLQTVQTLIGYELAGLKSSVANWKLQQANLELANANLRRGKELIPQGAMSKEEYDQREAASKVAQQQVDSAAQAVQQARRCQVCRMRPARMERPTPACRAISISRFPA